MSQKDPEHCPTDQRHSTKTSLHSLRTSRRRALQVGLGLSGCLLSGCDPFLYKYPPPPAKLGTFPYHPLVFHLDLSILAYQLHAQSLVWPVDPFYEERTKGNGVNRSTFMGRVATWAAEQGVIQSANESGLDSYRGPGVLAGFDNNLSHDPILYNYARLYPWSSTIMNALGRWTEYLTPTPITAPISQTYVSYRVAGEAEKEIDVESLQHTPETPAKDANDILIAFEGGTGDKGERGQPASQSIMGFVLMRTTGDESYDVHIGFRGSRSGKASRAALDALSNNYAGGNPDWITDLGWNPIRAVDGGGHITTTGSVSRGFARSIQLTLPAIIRALEQIATLKASLEPDNIYVTGHSLGGALAQHFTSAILLGDSYGPKGQGAAMPVELKAWPWHNIKLITYGAPRAGDTQWAHVLTTKELQSEFFKSPLSPYDTEAHYVTDPEIVERLRNPDRPAAFRVLISTDAITTEKVSEGAHVGKTIYVNGDLLTGWLGLPSFEAHEPKAIREYMTNAMADPRNPADAWNYHSLKALDPSRDDERAGSQQEFIKLGQSLLNYYQQRELWFDIPAFQQEMQLLLSLG